MASPQATEAAARKRRERVAALGAVTLPDAAAARRIDVTTMQKWAPRSESAFRGPQRMWLFRDAELDAELEQWRCTWEDGCPEFALLSTSSPRRCKRHAADVDRRGGVMATELARELGVDPVDLLERVKKGEIPAERVDRGGRPAAYRLDRDEAVAVIERDFLCQWHGGCRSRGGRPGYALGESRHCREHAAGAASIARAAGKVRVTCPGCGDVREDYPSQQRAGELCTRCNPRQEAHAALKQARAELIARKRAEGRVPLTAVAAKWHLAPTSSLATHLVRVGIAHERQLGVLFFDMSDVRRHRVERYECDGRFRAAPQSRDPKRLRVVRGAFGASHGDRGGRPGLTRPERDRILELTAKGQTQQQIAIVLTGERRLRVIAAAAEAGLPKGLAIDDVVDRLGLPLPEVARDAVGRVQRASKAVRNPS